MGKYKKGTLLKFSSGHFGVIIDDIPKNSRSTDPLYWLRSYKLGGNTNTNAFTAVELDSLAKVISREKLSKELLEESNKGFPIEAGKFLLNIESTDK